MNPKFETKMCNFKCVNCILVYMSFVGKSGFLSHTKHIAEAINMDLFHL